MFSKTFFEAYGEVLHAVAMADGEVQTEELGQLMERIQPILKPLEGSEVYALRSVWFLDSAVVPDGPGSIQRFVQHCREHKVKLNPKQADALVQGLQETARAYNQVEASEQNLIDAFRQQLASLS